jgi:hypothetical protein
MTIERSKQLNEHENDTRLVKGNVDKNAAEAASKMRTEGFGLAPDSPLPVLASRHSESKSATDNRPKSNLVRKNEGAPKTGSVNRADKAGEKSRISELYKTVDSLPPLVLLQNSELEKATLGSQALESKSAALHQAINKKELWLLNNPDSERILNLLRPLNHRDREKLTETYGKLFGQNRRGAMDTELKAKLKASDYALIKAKIDRPDKDSDVAGEFIAALTQTKFDSKSGSAQLRQVFLHANAVTLAKLDAQLHQAGKSGYWQQIRNTETNLDEATQVLLPYITKPIEDRTSDDYMSMAKTAVVHKDMRIFQEALSGATTPVAEARQLLKKDSQFLKQLAQAFPQDFEENEREKLNVNETQQFIAGLIVKVTPIGIPHFVEKFAYEHSVEKTANHEVTDILNFGHLTLPTIADRDSGRAFFDNKLDLDIAIKNVGPDESRLFKTGEALVLSGKKAVNEELQHSIDYYTRLHKTLTNKIGVKEAALAEDHLRNGRQTAVSNLLNIHSDGILGIGSGHSCDAVAKVAENLSEK